MRHSSNTFKKFNDHDPSQPHLWFDHLDEVAIAYNLNCLNRLRFSKLEVSQTLLWLFEHYFNKAYFQIMDHSGYRPEEWQKALHNNGSSHWLSAYPECFLRNGSMHCSAHFVNPRPICVFWHYNTLNRSAQCLTRGAFNGRNDNKIHQGCELIGVAHQTCKWYSISQEICTRFLLCCALLWLYIDWFSHIH